ncbi:MAG: hypothetical protein V3V15_09120 [Sphingorhabdus sp.]
MNKILMALAAVLLTGAAIVMTGADIGPKQASAQTIGEIPVVCDFTKGTCTCSNSDCKTSFYKKSCAVDRQGAVRLYCPPGDYYGRCTCRIKPKIVNIVRIHKPYPENITPPGRPLPPGLGPKPKRGNEVVPARRGTPPASCPPGTVEVVDHTNGGRKTCRRSRERAKRALPR